MLFTSEVTIAVNAAPYCHIHYVALGYEVLEFAYELDFSDLFNTLTYCLECLYITNVLVLCFLFC